MTKTFQLHTIVFYRRDVQTGTPLTDSPHVWTFDADDGDNARQQFELLKTKTHLFVPQNGLTTTTHKCPTIQSWSD